MSGETLLLTPSLLIHWRCAMDGSSEPEDLVVFEIHMSDRGENYWSKFIDTGIVSIATQR